MNLLVLPHSGPPLLAHNLWTAWQFEPSLLIPLVLLVGAYLWGVRRVWRRAGAGHGITPARAACFLGALLALVMALLSPLDALSEVSFAAHMVQHMLLILVAAPLLVLSDLPLALLWALPRPWAHELGYRLKRSLWVERPWRVTRSPVAAWLWFTITLWAWHARGLYEAALQDETLHALEHLALLLAALLFWRVLLNNREPDHVGYGMAVPYLFTTVLQTGVLGALMTFSTRPWYPYYAALVTGWGLTPLQDQQLAGLIMWVPGGAVLSLLTVWYFAAWLRVLEQRSARLEYGEPLPATQEQES